MRTYRYHKDHLPQIFDSQVTDMAQLAADGWVDSPAKLADQQQYDLPKDEKPNYHPTKTAAKQTRRARKTT